MKVLPSNKLVLLAVLWSVLTAAGVRAEEPDPFHGRLLPLELVMSFRQDIKLTREQNDRIGKLVVEMQKNVAEKQWRMQAAYFDLIEQLDREKIDETKALKGLQSAVGTENEIKLEHIRFLIRLRNLLSAEQIATLRQKLAEGWTESKQG